MRRSPALLRLTRRLSYGDREAPDPTAPRPERTPAALRVALAQVAPHRLGEMERQKDEAVALAAQTAAREEPAWRAAMDEIRELHVAAGKALADG